MPVPDVVIPPDAVARFTAAEARLYPMAMTDAASYQRATALVGAVLTHLRERSVSIGDVLGRRQELIDGVPALAQAATLALDGLPAAVIVDAASAVRCRELQAANSASERQARIQAARAAGDEWFVTEPNPAEVMSGTYRSVEVHLPTGATLITSIEAGDASMGATYSVEVLHPAGGPASSAACVYSDRETWMAAVDEIRNALVSEA